jgi:hypothetical protein
MDSVLADDDLFQHEPKIGEVDPGFGTRGLIWKPAVPFLNGADDDEKNEILNIGQG